MVTIQASTPQTLKPFKPMNSAHYDLELTPALQHNSRFRFWRSRVEGFKVQPQEGYAAYTSKYISYQSLWPSVYAIKLRQGICYKATLGVDSRMKKGSHVGRRFLLCSYVYPSV